MLRSLLVLFSLLLLYSCAHDSLVSPKNGTLSLTFAKEDRTSSGGRIATETTPAFILLSIADGNDSPILTDQKIALISFGAGYVLENPIQLAVGAKKLKKFMVLNSFNEAIYAAPVRGSVLASLVNHPLDIDFDISANATTNVDVEVLQILDTDNPEDFGFASFTFHVVDRLPRLKHILYFDPAGPLFRESFQYTGAGDLPSRATTYSCMDSTMENCTPGEHWETVIDPVSGKVQSLNNYLDNGTLDRSIKWFYNADGSLKTMVSNASVNSGIGGVREDFYHHENGQLNYSIWRRTAEDTPSFNGYVRLYTFGDDGNISKIDTRYCTVFNGALTIREQYVMEEYRYDNHPTEAILYNDIYWWAPFFSSLPRKNNITWTKFTSYSLTGSEGQVTAVVADIVEITRTYEYNQSGLPSKETVSIPGYNGFTYEVDGAVRKYVY